MSTSTTYGYEPTPTDAERYGHGYGQAPNEATTNGGDPLGYGSMHSTGTADSGRQRRERPRRRGSVTKYSLDAQTQVKEPCDINHVSGGQESLTEHNSDDSMELDTPAEDSMIPKPSTEDHTNKQRWPYGRKK